LKIELGTLKDKGEELATFLEPRVGAKPTLSGDAIEIEDEGVREGVRPRQVKTYIKRFLYMKGVRKNYRVFVAGKELTIQEIELGEEKEEKEEKKAPKAAEAPAPEVEEAEEEKPAEEAEPKAEKPKKAAAKKPRAKKKKAEDEA
jgi:hypothetical protein